MMMNIFSNLKIYQCQFNDVTDYHTSDGQLSMKSAEFETI